MEMPLCVEERALQAEPEDFTLAKETYSTLMEADTDAQATIDYVDFGNAFTGQAAAAFEAALRAGGHSLLEVPVDSAPAAQQACLAAETALVELETRSDQLYNTAREQWQHYQSCVTALDEAQAHLSGLQNGPSQPENPRQADRVAERLSSARSDVARASEAARCAGQALYWTQVSFDSMRDEEDTIIQNFVSALDEIAPGAPDFQELVGEANVSDAQLELIFGVFEDAVLNGDPDDLGALDETTRELGDFFGVVTESEKREFVFSMLGIDVSLEQPAAIQELHRLFAELPNGLLEELFDQGQTLTLNANLWGTGTNWLLSPLAGSASLDASIEFALTDPRIGIGFGQTQVASVSATFTSTLGGRVGKSPLQSLYKHLRRVGLSGPIERLFAGTPLLGKLAKGLPFSVAYEQFVGMQLDYEATLTPEQAQALDAGSTEGMPNIFDPSTFESGNSILMRGGAVEGSNFAFKYKALKIDESFTEFSGLGFGVTALDNGNFAVFSGPVEAVESQVTIGLPYVFGFEANRELSYADFEYAELDLSTPEGAAAYQEFISGGGVPTTGGNGVITADVDQTTYDHSTALNVNLGFVEQTYELSDNQTQWQTTTFSDGSQQVSTTYSSDNVSTQIVAGVNADETVDWGNATTTIMVPNVDSSFASILNNGFSDVPVDFDAYRSDQHIQIELSGSDVERLQATTEGYLHTVYGDHYDDMMQMPDGFMEEFVTAETPTEALEVLLREVEYRPGQVLHDLASMTAESNSNGPAHGALGGSISFQEAG